MDWTEIKLFVPTKDTEVASAIANMAVPYGIYVEDYSDLEEGAREIAHIDLIDEDLLAKDRTHSIIHLYIDPDESPAEAVAFLRERLTAEGIAHTVSSDEVREEDWANNWKKYFKPLVVGEKLLICPSWEQPGELAQGRQILKIDPGMAFGTGGHDTTRLVLTVLENAVREGDTLLDVGCGSGILSIAALLLGAKSALGVDIDPLAVRTAIDNGVENDMTAPTYQIVEGDLVDKVSGTFDVVVANIVADAIIMLSPAVRPFLKDGGTYIVSGIIDSREADVLPALDAAGFAVVERFESRGWVCLKCTTK